MRRQHIVIFISILVSAALIFFVLRDVPLREVGNSLRAAHIGWILTSFGLMFFTLWTRAVRWRGLLDNQITTWDAFYLLGITMMLNQLPLRAGEVVRSLFATRRGIPFMTAATSILIERLLDVLFVVVMIAAAITQLPDAQPDIIRGALLLGTVGIIGFIILLFFARYPHVARSIRRHILHFLPFLRHLPLEKWTDQIISGLQPLTHWRKLGHAIIWTILSWISSMLVLYALIRALDISTDPLLTTAIGIGLTSLSIAIPVSVASIGLFEGAIKLTGEVVAMDPVAATALGFLFHGAAVLSYVASGVIGMIALGVSFGDILERTDIVVDQ